MNWEEEERRSSDNANKLYDQNAEIASLKTRMQDLADRFDREQESRLIDSQQKTGSVWKHCASAVGWLIAIIAGVVLKCLGFDVDAEAFKK